MWKPGNSILCWAGLFLIVITAAGCSMNEESDMSAPADVSGLSAQSGNGFIFLSWTNPSDADFRDVIITRAASDSVTVGGNTVTVKGSTTVIENLSNDILYTFTVKAGDKSGNYSNGKSISAAPVIGETEIATGICYTLDISGASYLVAGCTEKTTEISIDSKFNNLPVSGFVDNAFKDNTTITSVCIPSSISSFSAGVFSGCSSVKSVYYTGASESAAGAEAACLQIPLYSDACADLSNAKWFFSGSDTAINDFSFKLTGDGYTITGYSGTAAVIVIPSAYNKKAVIGISDKAFYGNTNLISVTIPSAVVSVGAEAFASCTRLVSFNYNADAAVGTSVLSGSGSTAGFKITIGSAVKTIPAELLKEALVTEVAFSSDSAVTTIGTLFAGNTTLVGISLPEGVTKIVSAAFKGCSALVEIKFPQSLTAIGSNAFEGCTSLRSVTIPENVTTIETKSFINTPSLTCLNYNAVNVTAGSYPFEYSGSSEGMTVTVGSRVTAIPANAFTWSGISRLVFTGRAVCTSIGKNAFSQCSLLKEVAIPASVVSVGDFAFTNDYALSTVNYDAVDAVSGTNIFFSDKSTAAPLVVNFGASVKMVPDYIFNECSTLTEVGFDSACSCISIGVRAFADCTSLVACNVPDTVVEIKDYAFNSCKKLSGITIPEKLSSMGKSVFDGCSSIGIVYCDASNKESIIPSVLTSASGNFYSVIFGKKVPVVYQWFTGNSRLVSVTFQDKAVCTEIAEEAFSGCTNLTEVYLGVHITNIGDNAFNGCSALKTAVCSGIMPRIGSGNEYFSAVVKVVIPAASGAAVLKTE
jgi:hypothetical protein